MSANSTQLLEFLMKNEKHLSLIADIQFSIIFVGIIKARKRKILQTTQQECL